VQSPHGDEGARRTARRKRLVIAIPLAQAHEERCHILLADEPQVVEVSLVEEL
jgi:hypothetical protein